MDAATALKLAPPQNATHRQCRHSCCHCCCSRCCGAALKEKSWHLLVMLVLMLLLVYQVEKMYLDNGVDIILCGHDHVYERSYPTYDGKRDANAPYMFTIGKPPSQRCSFTLAGQHDLRNAGSIFRA